MSLLFFMIAGAVVASIQEAAETRQRRAALRARRARRYSFN